MMAAFVIAALVLGVVLAIAAAALRRSRRIVADIEGNFLQLRKGTRA
jgi:hypothetical protein